MSSRANWISQLAYCAYRVLAAVLGVLTIEQVFWIGKVCGLCAYWLLPKYRALARSNLRIAFADWPEEQAERCAQQNFGRIGANFLAAFVMTRRSWPEVQSHLDLTAYKNDAAKIASFRGAIGVVSHLGNWELFGFSPHWIEKPAHAAVYQPFRNLLIDRDFHLHREKEGMQFLDRRAGFGAAIEMLRRGGVLGILIDQHAGDKGLWMPFFGRLASVTTLAAILLKKTNTDFFSAVMSTAGTGRWIWSSKVHQIDRSESVEEITALMVRDLEEAIRRDPTDWFWVHNRWKTPSPRFLLRSYKRGVFIPPGTGTLQPFKILIRSANWLGDAVMSVEAVRRIKRGRPDAHVTILVKAKLADFWRTVREVDDIITIDEGEGVWQVAAKIRRRFEVAILFPNSVRTGLEVWLARIPRRVGYRSPWRNLFLNQFVPEPRLGPIQHQSRLYQRIAATIGADMEEPLPVIKHDAFEADLIGLCPGAEYGSAKRWPNFADLPKALRRPDLRWLILGTAKESGLAEQITANIGPNAENLTGRTSLAQLIEAVRRCRLIVTNDTGTMHLAAHLGVPTVAIFGSTEPALTGPVGSGHIVLRNHVECSPCFLRECPIDFRCMRTIGVEQVARAVETILARTEVAPASAVV